MNAKLSPLDMTTRLPKLRGELETCEADALLVTNLVNVRYLTGFSGSAATFLVTEDAALLVTDGRYRTQAAEQLDAAGLGSEVELRVGRVSQQREHLAELAKRIGVHRLGLEAENISWGAKRRMVSLFADSELVATEGLVERLRETKDQGEIDRMAKAAEIADEALAEVLPMLADGISEEDFALALDTSMRRLGAEDRAFDTIVASGPNAAKPHARPCPRRIGRAEPVVIDFGATYEGYRSDMTRTVFVGEEPEEPLAKVYAVVAEAQSAGVSSVREGVCAGDVDRACRELVDAAGWGEAFEHGTGHGVGLDIHEAPAVAEGSTAILASGFVVTVEPGVYLPGIGGVRIEDTVVVTGDGSRTLTRFTKDFAVPAA